MTASLVLLLWTACLPKEEEEEPFQPELVTLASERLSPDAGGQAVLEVEVPPEAASMLLTGRYSRDDGDLRVLTMVDPDGLEVYNAYNWLRDTPDHQLTLAHRTLNPEVVLNWPVRAQDGPLTPGTWQVEFDVRTDDAPEGDIDVVTQLNLDDDVSTGTLRATIVYADGVRDEDGIVEATEAAVEIWRDIWASVGLELEVSYVDTDAIGAFAESPNEGDASFRQASELGDDDDITVVIVRGFEDMPNSVLAVTGNIPATLLATERSALVVSWLRTSGWDGEYDGIELDMYGETLAHEAGHYIGLFHPVEQGWYYWDALDDTEACDSQRSCEDALGENMMFPYAVCNGSTLDSCIPSQQLSEQQAGVLRHYAGVY